MMSDMRRTAAVLLSLFVGVFFLSPTPPPAQLFGVFEARIDPLNIYLSEEYFTRALEAMRTGDHMTQQAYITAAIAFDTEVMSVRYKAYQQARDAVLNP